MGGDWSKLEEDQEEEEEIFDFRIWGLRVH